MFLPLVLVASCGPGVLAVAKPVYEVETTCAEGINQNPNETQENQCADALNVWAPNGFVEDRPGKQGVSGILISGGGAATTLLYEDVSAGTFTVSTNPSILDLSNADARTVAGGVVTVQPDRWYIGNGSPFIGVYFVLVTTNSNAVQAESEYWNGVAWRPLPGFSELAYSALSAPDISLQKEGAHLSASNLVAAQYRCLYSFVLPADWAASSIAGTTNYWIRFVLVNNGSAALDGTTSIDNGGGTSPVQLYSPPTTEFIHGIVRAQFPTTKAYVVLRGAASRIYLLDSLSPTNEIVKIAATASERGISPTVAVIPEVGEFYVAHNAQTFRFSSSPTINDDILAHAEDRDFAIGPGAPWDQRTVALLGAFPAAKFIMYFQNRLWIMDKDDLLHWSASTPYHRVWPALAFARFAEDDNSPTTGLAALQEFAIITKTDSIWMAAFEGMNAFDVPMYTARKVVSGTGCVSNGSIQKIGGELVFLGEEDIIAFDGVKVRSVTEDKRTGARRLKDLLARVTPGARQWASSIHWKAKKTYLLSVPLDGAINNTHTIVWDYKRDTFWLWDVAADFWMLEEGPNDEEVPYFATTGGYVYRLGGNDDDGIPFSSYVTTRRLGWNDGAKKALISIEVNSRNTSESITLDVYRNGSDISSRTVTMALHTPSSSDWGTGLWGTAKWAPNYESHHFSRAVRVGNAHHAQVKITKGNGPLKVYTVSAGFTPFPGRQ